MERDDVEDADGTLDETVRAQRTRARWKKLRAATLVFLLFRRRVHHDTRRSDNKPQQQHRRMPTSVFFAKTSVQAATAAAAQRLLAKPPPAAASPQLTRWCEQKLHLFERLIRKPFQCRDDVDIKILGEFIRQTKFFQGLTSASIDALAQVIRFRTYHEGEVLHLQGSEVQDTSGRYLVVTGSLLVYKNPQFALRAREGEDYIQWFLANTPGATTDTIRYGDCVETCSTGDTTGDDATLGYLFREHSVISQAKTVIAYVIQADYKRVVRFNVDKEPQLLDAVREIFAPPKMTKQNAHQTNRKEPSRPDLSPRQVRILMRFLGRFKCFRILPYQFCLEIASKLQLSTVKSDEVLCLSSDDEPSLVMVLDGKVCVHVSESYESQRLACREDIRFDFKSHASSKKPVSLQAAEYLPGCEAGSTVKSSIDANTLHLCSLTAGDSFGEVAMSSAESRLQGASIYHPFTTSGQIGATVVRMPRRHYMAALQRYTETADFNLTTVSSILSRTLPQDRTDEQVQYMKIFLQLCSSARLFFDQLPSRVLDGVLLHASIDRKDVEEEIGEFIQKEGSAVESMKIVLNGYVGVFKGATNLGNPSSTSNGAHDAPISPTRAVLRRYQSRLIRANTHILDTSGAKHSARPASIGRTAQARPIVVVPERQEADRADTHAIDPVSVLPSGAAFGHLQILTGQPKSLYSYTAFASGSGVSADTRSAATTDAKRSIYLLSIPARFVHLYLASLDGQIVYNPLRAVKRLQHEGLSMGKDEAVPASTIRQLQLPLFLARKAAFTGIPKSIASSMIEDMDVVRVEPRHVIYEVGAPIQRALFVVLSGSVRVFSYVSKTKTKRDSRNSLLPGSDERKPKLPRRISQNTSEGPTASGEWTVSFSKPASDAIFLSDYNQTTELVCGDIFGRHEVHSFAKARAQKPSTGPIGSIQQANPQSVYAENVVTMTDCLLGIVRRREQQCELSCDERRLLVRMIDDRKDTQWGVSTGRIDEDDGSAFVGTFDSLVTSFQVLESMDLAHRLPTLERVYLANRLKYIKLAPGETVYKQGESSEAIYFVLFGSVTLYVKGHSDVVVDPGTRGFVPHDAGSPLIEVMEGEVFGDESLECSHGCTRRCTTVATVEDAQETVLVYVTRADFELAVERKSTLAVKDSASQAEAKTETALRLLGLGERIISAKERWKMAISQVVQLRAQRSQWPTVLTKARNHRIDLLFDLIKNLPAFEDTPTIITKNLCCNAVLQTFTQDTVIYGKSDTAVDTCYLVVQGSVTLYQTYYGSGAASASSASTILLPQVDSSSIRVTIQVIEPGELFGEFEMMEEHSCRHINAIVRAPGTKIVVIQQEAFFASWPKRDRKERKLSVLTTQLRNLCRLDADQLCSLYYGMKECTFRRQEVITGNVDQAGVLHVIQDGECVVHDAVVLKHKKSETTRRSPTKVSLDARVSTVGPGAILFTDRHDVALPLDSRRTSARSLDIADTAAPIDPPRTTQYVVVDSPIVTTFCVQLFPKRPLSMQRQPDLLAVFLLGKSGVQVIRDTVEMQAMWRAHTVAQTGRLVAHSFSQSADRVSEFAKRSLDVVSDQRARIPKPMMQKDIAKALLRHDAGSDSPRPMASPHKPTPPSPRLHCGQSLITPLQSVTLGSFSPVTRTKPPPQHQLLMRECASAVPSPPILLPNLTSLAFGAGSASPKSPRCETLTNGGSDRDEQLRKEERVLVALTRPSPRQEMLTKTQQQQMRRRHGRPPPKRVENNSAFVDEHAVVPVTQIRDEHERKKAGLCRRLLHVKCVTER